MNIKFSITIKVPQRDYHISAVAIQDSEAGTVRVGITDIPQLIKDLQTVFDNNHKVTELLK